MGWVWLWTLAMASPCSASADGRYAQGDQVYVRQGPSADAPVVDALPFGTCVRTQETMDGWVRLRGEGAARYVAEALLVAEVPQGVPSAAREQDPGFCGVTASPSGQLFHLVGDPWRCVPFLPYSYGSPPLQPAPDVASMGAWERSAPTHLTRRMALWTRVFDRDAAYRRFSQVETLAASPPFAPFPGAPADPNHLPDVWLAEPEVSFAATVGSSELAKPAAPSTEAYLFYVQVDGDTITWAPSTWGQLGVSEGSFPAGTFLPAQEPPVVRFSRDLSGALFNGCTSTFEPVRLTSVHYDPSTGQLRAQRASFDPSGCLSAPVPEIPWSEQLLVVDETSDQRVLAALTQPGVRRDVRPALPEGGPGYAAEVRWSVGTTPVAFLRMVLQGDCGVSGTAVLQFSSQGWQRVVARVHAASPCGT